jgi:AcrR family transcriptional regulator
MERPQMTDSAEASTPPLEQYAQLKPRTVPIQKRARETVDLILEAAAELVDEVGVVAFTTDLLAQRAGIRIRTIYRYFPNKVGVLRALLLHLNAESEEQLGPFSPLADRERDWRDVVNAWVDDLVTWCRTRRGVRLIMGWAYAIPELLEEQERLNREWTQDMACALRERGVELPSNQLVAVCRTFIEMLDTVSIFASGQAHADADDVVEEMRRALIGYLANYLD